MIFLFDQNSDFMKDSTVTFKYVSEKLNLIKGYVKPLSTHHRHYPEVFVKIPPRLIPPAFLLSAFKSEYSSKIMVQTFAERENVKTRRYKL